jgi:hypothetical protein
MITRPCLRNLDRPIVALWGLEPVDLLATLGAVGVLMVLSNIGIALAGGVLVCLALKALKAGKPRGYVFYLFYRSGILRWAPLSLRPPYLVIPPGPGSRRLRFSAAPGPEDDRTPEAEYFRRGKEYLN